MNLRYTLLVAFFAATTTFAQTEFITVWETKTAGETITIPTFSGEAYNYTVDWGDGTPNTTETTDATHPYATPGKHTVKITGTFPRILFNFSANSAKILEVSQWGTQAWTSMEEAFKGCENLNITASDIPNLTSVTSLASMFFITDLTTANRIGDWDVSGVTDMFAMFAESVNFNSDISRWDVSNVTTMGWMFNSAYKFNQDLSAWKVDNVTNMEYMLADTNFNHDISGWKVDNVTDMSSMFYDATAFNQDISNWNVGNVTNMEGMFSDATAFDQDLSAWKVDNVTDMRYMFSDAIAFNQDLSVWNVSKVTDMSYMFENATAFDQDLSAWDIRSVTDMTDMFDSVTLSTANYDSMLDSWSKKVVQNNVNFHGGNSKYCSLGETGKTALQNNNGWTFTDGGKDTLANCPLAPFITVWETTSPGESITIPTATSGEVYNYTVDWGDGMTSTNQTTDATHPYANPGQYTVKISGTFPRIFFNTTGDKNKILEVAQWGTQAWTSMEKAFDGCSKLNITAVDIPDLTSVTSLKHMFRNSNLTTANRIGDWDVSSVEDMEGMFERTAINADLSAWDTSSVTDMQWMFTYATAFNQDISTWDVGNVTNMHYMFGHITVFDQDLSAWDIRKVTDMSLMFAGVTLSTTNYDSMLDSWSKKVVQNNVIFDAGNSRYCDLGEAGRTALQTNYGWTFTDGLKDSTVNCAALSIENPQQNTWALYPNPVESRIYISGSTAPQRIQVFGIDGKKHKDIQDTNSLEVEQLKAGLYMVKLIGRENTEVFKVIKR